MLQPSQQQTKPTLCPVQTHSSGTHICGRDLDFFTGIFA